MSVVPFTSAPRDTYIGIADLEPPSPPSPKPQKKHERPADCPNDDEATCTCGEFEQMVTRLAREKVPDATEPFEATLDAFLTLHFVPAYRSLHFALEHDWVAKAVLASLAGAVG